MPRLKITGDALGPGAVGPRNSAANTVARPASAPIELNRWFRNGRHPTADALNMMCEAGNTAGLYRSKEVFRSCGTTLSTPNSTAGTRKRFRFAFHSGPYAHAVMAMAVMAPPTSGWANDTYGKLTLYTDVTETTSIGSVEFHYGPGPNGTTTASGWAYLKPVMMFLPVSPDTDYYGVVSDETYGRIQSICVAELPSMTENFDGYMAVNNSIMTPVVDSFRGNLAALTRDVWKKGAATVLNWTVADQSSPVVASGVSATNIINSAFTSVSSSTPGYTLDMTNKARLRDGANGVPVAMKVFAKSSINGAGGVFLKNSGGTVMSVTTALTTTAKWYSTTGYLTAGSDKYDLMAIGDGGTGTTVYAVSIYEYET